MNDDEFSSAISSNMLRPAWKSHIVQIAIAAFICGFIGFIYMGFVTYLTPKVYESTALIRILPTTSDRSNFDREEFVSECHAMKSHRMLSKLSKFTDTPLSQMEKMDELEKQYKVLPLKESFTAEVSVRNSNPERARDIVIFALDEYKNIRAHDQAELIKKKIVDANNAIDQQNIIVEKAYKKFLQVANRNHPTATDSTPHDLDLRLAEDDYENAYAELVHLKSQHSQLKRQEQAEQNYYNVLREPLISQKPLSAIEKNLIDGLRNGAIIGALGMIIFLFLSNGKRQRAA